MLSLLKELDHAAQLESAEDMVTTIRETAKEVERIRREGRGSRH
jgi:hypothetical protein